jgi:hypothetical protein
VKTPAKSRAALAHRLSVSGPCPLRSSR